MKHKPIKKLFIANRGEIARRIALSCRKLGIKSVALYSGEQPHAFLLDAVSEFIQVPSETTELYLNPQRMLELARQSGCDAIHPGFGFLSENAGFARACSDAGFTWVGPTADSIAAMASKAAAKNLAEKAGVPIIPGLENITYDAKKPNHQAIETFARKAGYPLLFKAALGGGGKGMRIVTQASEIPEALQRAASEGLNSFGDGSLIVERYLTKPRHVEVQIFGDQHGHVVAFGDRDCSLQRRHQKIIEEAPAPDLTPETRKAMHAAAIKLAKAVNYVSAGTVEFLVDWSDTARQAAATPFFFLEMNTRLQVEHPVTEEVFGLDLVAWQLRVAQGEPLPDDFAHRAARGHSIEVRIYAEDTQQNFLPAPGPVLAFVPAQGPGIRWEVGVDTTDTITAAFDPMIAKLIATGENRAAAIARLLLALEETLLAGPKNNLSFLREVLRASTFKDGAIATDFIKAHADQLNQTIGHQQTAHDDQLRDTLKTIAAQGIPDSIIANGGHVSPATIINSAFSAAAVAPAKHPDGATATNVMRTLNQLTSRSPFLPRTQVAYGRVLLDRGGTTRACWYVLARAPDRSEAWLLSDTYATTAINSKSDNGSSGKTAKSDVQVTAPVPGKIVALRVEAGRNVAEGDILLVIESMKMEFEIRATRAGTVQKILRSQGEQVTAGDVLVVFEKTT